MELIAFMWDLVNHPEKLDRYKQDPTTYLEQEGASLSGADKHLLLHFSSQDADQSGMPTLSREIKLQEISTVTRFVVNTGQVSGTSTANNDTDPEPVILLNGNPVTLTSRAAVFLAEQNASKVDNVVSGGVVCRLLPHSYISLTNGVFFDLRLCYVGPRNLYDAPMVLHIKTVGPEPSENDRISLNDAQIQFYALDYVLLKTDDPIKVDLGPDSSYNPGTKELRLEAEFVKLLSGQ
ncbi:MAG TPA: hypothetical protein VGD58_15490 [Herpetosiphonaceae bacterium]